MEFEISADGELVAYHGTGGKVKIPEGVKFIARKGVFAKDCKITKLCLPSTLIGHKYDETVAVRMYLKRRISRLSIRASMQKEQGKKLS